MSIAEADPIITEMHSADSVDAYDTQFINDMFHNTMVGAISIAFASMCNVQSW